MNLKHLTDVELLEQTFTAVANDQKAKVVLSNHLTEVDSRKLRAVANVFIKQKFTNYKRGATPARELQGPNAYLPKEYSKVEVNLEK